MKSFIKTLFVFLIPVIIIGLVMEFKLRQIPNVYAYKSDYLAQHASEIETLLLGSSHTLYDLDPEYFSDNTFNLGHISQTLNIDYKLLDHYIDKLPNLKTVVLRLSYSTLFEKLDETKENWRIKNYNIYYPLNIEQHLKYNSEVLSVKLKNNINQLKEFYIEDKNAVDWNYLGWGTKLTQTNKNRDLDYLGEFVAKKHTAKDIGLFSELKETLNSFIKLCKNKNIEVILFTPPAHKSYAQHLDAKQYSLMKTTAVEMVSKYNNCMYFNFINDDTFIDCYFYDGDHLNAKGAKKLSDSINQIIKVNRTN